MLVTCWNSLVALYLWYNHSLLVTRVRSCSLQKITRYSLQNSHVTCCRSFSLQNFNRYSLPNLLGYSMENFARCKKSLVTHCKVCSFLVAEVTGCKNSLVICCKIRSLLVAEVACRKKQLFICCRYPLFEKNICHLLKQSLAGITASTKLVESFSFSNITCFLKPRNLKLFRVNILLWNLLLAENTVLRNNIQMDENSATTFSKSNK